MKNVLNYEENLGRNGSTTYLTRSEMEELEALDQESEEFEWEEEVNRKSREYIRWVQESLNKILGLRLSTDGIIGAQTRSAIRSFQQRNGLNADGLVGEKTEAAIKTALGQPSSPTSTGKRPAPAPLHGAQAAVGVNTACEVIDRFDFNGANVKADSHHQRQLAQVIARLMTAASQAGAPIPVRFIGHTDRVGNDAYNDQLGLKRANSVRTAVMNKLSAQSSLMARIDFRPAETLGEREPLADKAASRRVQICFPMLPQPTPPITPPKPPVTQPIPPEPVPTYPPAVWRWFKIGGQPRMPTVWAGNRVIPFVSGPLTFKSMVEAIKTAKGRGHFIYNIGCFYRDDFPLITGDSKTTMRSMLSSASQRGVQVRALLWDQFGRGNTDAVNFIDDLPNGAAILDNRTISRSTVWFQNIGVHHQKILIVYGEQGLIAFCGGMDINPNRLPSTSTPPSGSGGSGSGSGSGSGGGSKWQNPMHDVHCRITGPAAHDLLRVFRERWEDHPDHTSKDRKKGRLLNAPQPVIAGQTYVQISRTYGNGRRHPRVRGGYRFAPFGEQSIRHMVLHAIRQARRFIYIEDQYLVNLEISRALIQALPNIQHLTIVIPHSSLLETRECPQKHHTLRRQFIQALRKAGGNKVGVYYLAPIVPKGAPSTYVHSKIWVFDDEFAVIGSANINRRGYTHDSEVAAGIYDPGTPSLVKQLRISLWAKHLNVNSANLDDGVTSRRFWLSPPPVTRVAPFNELAPISAKDAGIPCDEPWDDVIDPDGS